MQHAMCVKNDPAICKIRDVLYEKHNHNKFQHVYISQKMRELGRFMLAVKELDKSVNSLQDVCVPDKFQTVVGGETSSWIHKREK